MAFSIYLKEFTFLISQRLPNIFDPFGLIETLASARKLPRSKSPSEMSKLTTKLCNFLRYSEASSGEEISGALTISIKPTPERLKSTNEHSPTWIFFPASSSI